MAKTISNDSYDRRMGCRFISTLDRVDVTPEMEKWARRAALACAARLAHCSISGAASTLSSLYIVVTGPNVNK